MSKALIRSDDRFNDKNVEFWSVMKALLTDNDDFLNFTVLESLLEYASSIPLYSDILVPHSRVVHKNQK